MDQLSQQVYQKIKSTFPESRNESIIEITPHFPQPLSLNQIQESVRDFPELDQNTLIIVNDHYRSTPSQLILKTLREVQARKHGLHILIATGTHRPLPVHQARKFLQVEKKDTVYLHSVYDNTDFVYKGVTTRGTPVYSNSLLEEFDNIVTINGVEPHYFAGFTGGVKSLAPGITSRETTVMNHRWALDPNSMGLKTNGNPVFEDLWEAANMIRPLNTVQSIQLVNHGEKLFGVYTGTLPDAFEKARTKAIKSYGIPFNEKVQHVISLVEPPLQKNLYQAHKAMENTKQVLEDGGTMTLVATCHEGLGTRRFYDRMREFGSIKKIMENIRFESYVFGDHKAFKWSELASRVRLYYLGELSTDIIGPVFMKKITIETLLEQIQTWLKKGERILLDTMGGYAFYFYKK